MSVKIFTPQFIICKLRGLKNTTLKSLPMIKLKLSGYETRSYEQDYIRFLSWYENFLRINSSNCLLYYIAFLFQIFFEFPMKWCYLIFSEISTIFPLMLNKSLAFQHLTISIIKKTQIFSLKLFKQCDTGGERRWQQGRRRILGLSCSSNTSR